jgi:DNA-binding CsgD family transcriptional regulator
VNPWNLTPAECRLMSAICQHGNDKRVSDAAGIKENTIAWHLRNIMDKMGVRNRTVAAVMFDREQRA